MKKILIKLTERNVYVDWSREEEILFLTTKGHEICQNMAKRKMNTDAIIASVLDQYARQHIGRYLLGTTPGVSITPCGSHLPQYKVVKGEICIQIFLNNKITGIPYSNEWNKCYYNNANNYVSLEKLAQE